MMDLELPYVWHIHLSTPPQFLCLSVSSGQVSPESDSVQVRLVCLRLDKCIFIQQGKDESISSCKISVTENIKYIVCITRGLKLFVR